MDDSIVPLKYIESQIYREHTFPKLDVDVNAKLLINHEQDGFFLKHILAYDENTYFFAFCLNSSVFVSQILKFSCELNWSIPLSVRLVIIISSKTKLYFYNNTFCKHFHANPFKILIYFSMVTCIETTVFKRTLSK